MSKTKYESRKAIKYFHSLIGEVAKVTPRYVYSLKFDEMYLQTLVIQIEASHRRVLK